jgi:hypothetical protein
MYKFAFTIESISLTIEVIYHITSLSFDQIVKDLSHLFTIYLTTKKTIKKKEKSVVYVGILYGINNAYMYNNQNRLPSPKTDWP